MEPGRARQILGGPAISLNTIDVGGHLGYRASCLKGDWTSGQRVGLPPLATANAAWLIAHDEVFHQSDIGI